MELNCFKTYTSNDCFTSDFPVDPNGFLNFSHSFYDSNTSFLDENCMTPQSNDPSYLSSHDVNTSISVDECYQNVGMPMCNNNNQIHFYPQFSANSSLHYTEPHKLNLDHHNNLDIMFIPTNITGNKTSVVKGHWTPEEDRLLTELVEEHGTKKWTYIAQMLGGRVGKQCRERWHNHLKPDIKKGNWSMEEEKILIEAHSNIGNKWVEISKRLPGRTENSIKNHWNATMRKHMSICGYKNGKRKHSTLDGSLLQNYIKTLSIGSWTTTAAALTTNDKEKNSCNGTKVACSSRQTLYHYESDISCGDNKSMHEMYDFYARMPSVMLPTSFYESNHAEREMDF